MPGHLFSPQKEQIYQDSKANSPIKGTKGGIREDTDRNVTSVNTWPRAWGCQFWARSPMSWTVFHFEWLLASVLFSPLDFLQHGNGGRRRAWCFVPELNEGVAKYEAALIDVFLLMEIMWQQQFLFWRNTTYVLSILTEDDLTAPQVTLSNKTMDD